MSQSPKINPDALLECRHCPRLRAYRDKNQTLYPDYWNKPVPASGQVHFPLTILGLAPGLHGANKTGAPFTGDASGDLLFRCLKRLGLKDLVRITNAVKCAPPQNLPLASERKNCRKFLGPELLASARDAPRVIFCLGRIAHEEALRAFALPQKQFKFGHGNVHELDDQLWIVDTYHCSRYNINTGRITEPMFESALQCAAQLAQIELPNN